MANFMRCWPLKHYASKVCLPLGGGDFRYRRSYVKVPVHAGQDKFDRPKQRVVEQLYSLTRTKPSVTWQWAQYCLEQGLGVRDARKLPAGVIRKFLKMESKGLLPHVELASESLVQALKVFQRSGGKEALQAWNDYSLAAGFGIKDPRCNPSDMVQMFLERYAEPELWKQANQQLNSTDGECSQRMCIEGVEVVFIPPLATDSMHAHLPHVKDAPLHLPDGSCWFATRTCMYKMLLEYKVQKSLRLLQTRSMCFPTKFRVYESGRRHYRMRGHFQVDWSDINFEYRMDRYRFCSWSPGSVRLNEVLCTLRLRAPSYPPLLQNLHEVWIHTSSDGDAVAMLTYRNSLPDDWCTHATRFHDDEGVPLVGLPYMIGDKWWEDGKNRVLCDRDYIVEQFVSAGRVLSYRQIIGLFSQPNFGVCQHMLNWIEYQSQCFGKDLLELHCGSGLFSLALAHNFGKVFATEMSAELVKVAKENALLNNIQNVQFVQVASSALAQVLQRGASAINDNDVTICSEEFDFSTILVDPTRRGVDPCTLELMKSFDFIVYISCNVYTLARDLSQLSSTHAVKSFAFFDQFPYTVHIESCTVLARK